LGHYQAGADRLARCQPGRLVAISAWLCDGDVEPNPPHSISLGRLFQKEIKMRNLLIAACCAALIGSVSAAAAQTTGPTSQDSMKTTSPMDSNAKMKKKMKTKKTMKSDDSMSKGDAPKDSK
jgi:hypothetical protein